MCHQRQRERTKLFILAQRRARQTRRPLVVIGDPHNGIGSSFYGLFEKPAYSAGDIMIDIIPCDKCRADPTTRVMGGDVVTELAKLRGNRHVIYVSCVLEYIPHIGKAIHEIRRVAGSSDNIFISHVQSSCLTVALYPGFLTNHESATNVIYSAPPYSDTIKYKPLGH